MAPAENEQIGSDICQALSRPLTTARTFQHSACDIGRRHELGFQMANHKSTFGLATRLHCRLLLSALIVLQIG
jgi:hypothetical protein